ncbi:MAG: NfeD family protein [Syntrophorhabdaceae bacterium]|nr:NfeD family protein [Syntrophorhabdaceae bacterium]
MSGWEWAHAAIGMVATVIFFFQTFGAADGTDSETDLNAGADGEGGLSSGSYGFADYLSVRNLIALLMGYGWVALAALLSGASRSAASLLGLCAGVVLVFVSLFLLKAFLRFQETGTLDINGLAGKHASVYITIGESSSNAGKVMVDTKSGRIELPARTEDPETFRPGQIVRILRVDGGVLWVTRG